MYVFDALRPSITQLSLLLLLIWSQAASAETSLATWNLPVAISDQNTNVSFKVDSTWHTVHGATSGLSGTIVLADPKSPETVQVSLDVPVANFNTDNSRRDRRLREVMLAETYKTVHFESSGLMKHCTPGLVMKDSRCSDVLVGELTMLSTKKKVELPIEISLEGQTGFQVQGSIDLEWQKFGIEDPSILIAHVDPIVTIFFEVHLQPQTQ